MVLLFSAEGMDWQQCWVLVGGREHCRVSAAQAVQSMRSHLAGEVQKAAELSWGRARETLMWERQMLESNISDCQTLRITLGKLFKRQIQGPHSGRFYFCIFGIRTGDVHFQCISDGFSWERDLSIPSEKHCSE